MALTDFSSHSRLQFKHEAACCGKAKIRCDEFLELLELAKRTRAFDTLRLSHLHERCAQDHVISDGERLRLWIMLVMLRTRLQILYCETAICR